MESYIKIKVPVRTGFRIGAEHKGDQFLAYVYARLANNQLILINVM